MKSDGSTAKYYELPEGATQLQHLISAKDMNAQMGEIFRACYRYGEVDHSDQLRDAKKIKFYIDAEIERLTALTHPQEENITTEKTIKNFYTKNRELCEICNDAPKIADKTFCEHCSKLTTQEQKSICITTNCDKVAPEFNHYCFDCRYPTKT
jgi:tRNA A37 threonylcarbamoyladenosine modification protein TsaB